MTDLLRQLRERKLIQFGLAYIAGAAALFGGLVTVGQVFNWQVGVLRGLFVFMVAGFLATLVIAWFHGQQGRQRFNAVELAILAPIVLLGGIAAVRTARAGGNPADFTSSGHSVAVLPFVNMSGDKENEYFSDGITEEILNALANATDLKIPARTSSFSFKGQNLPIREIAKKLGVEMVLEGSVRRDANNIVRITVQLIDARTDRHLWSEQYDRSLSDIFAVQTEIARSIAGQLKLRLSDDGDTRRGTRDPAAYDLYLRGLAALNATSYATARDNFVQATVRDSTFALAYAGLSDALSQHNDLRPAKAAALRAVQLDDKLPEAQTALAYTKAFIEFDWEGGERGFQRALQLRPTYTPAMQYRAYALQIVGRHDEAVAEIDRAHLLDPLSMRLEVDRFLIYYLSRRYDRAIKQADFLLQINPQDVVLRDRRARALALQGRTDEAVQQYALLKDTFNLALIAHDTARALAIQQARDRTPVSTPGIYLSRAVNNTRLGQTDRALAWLDSAFNRQYRLIGTISLLPDLDPLRSDPRFQAMLRKLNLPEPVKQ